MNDKNDTKYGLGYVTRNIDLNNRTAIDFFIPVYEGEQDFQHKIVTTIFEPLFTKNKIEHLYLIGRNKQLVDKLTSIYSFLHFTSIQYCHAWYEGLKDLGAAHYDRILKSYENIEITDSCCPIIKFIRPGWENNINLENHILNILEYVKKNKIDIFQFINNIEMENSHEALKSYLYEASITIENITYARFGNFLRKRPWLNEGEFEDIKNNFNNMPPKDIYEYFNSHMVGENDIYITKPELNEFIKSAFELKNPPKEKITLKKHKKKDVHAIFYNFWIKAGHKHGEGKKYAKLCEDYFSGFKSVYANFNIGLCKKKIHRNQIEDTQR